MSDNTLIYNQSKSISLDPSLNYWQRYHLKQSPFEDYPQFAMYYPVVQWQQNLKYLQQFCQGARPLLLIQGEFGIGKTTLLTQFLTQLSANVTSYQIKGRNTITASQLIAEIAQGFQLPLILSQPTLAEQMTAELATLERLQKTCLLVIDDADLLPAETIATLAKLAIQQNADRIRLYILLACELDLQTHLENVTLEQGNAVYFPMLLLTPLSLEETKNYIKHRLTRAGLTSKFPFTKEMLLYVYELSAGVPGRINRVAQQMLIDLLKPDHQRISILKNNKSTLALFNLSRLQLVTFGLLLLLIAGVISFQLEKPLRSKSNGVISVPLQLTNQKKAITEAEVIGSNTASTVVQELPINSLPTNNIMPSAPRMPAVNKLPENDSKTLAENKMSVVANMNTPINPPQKNNAPKNNMAMQNNMQTNTQNPAVNTAIMLQPFKPAADIKVTEIVASKSDVETIYSSSEKKLLAMQGYTLQIMGSRLPSDLKRFIASHKLPAAQLHQFKTQYLSKPWYVLVYGNYADAKQAKMAAEKLPAAAKTLHPWVRPMTSVHAAIKQGLVF